MAKGTRPRGTLAERFWPKVDRNGPVPIHAPELGPCWLWTGYRLPWGYGQIGEGPAGGRHLYAHRVAWELTYGPIPDGVLALHRCDNPPCVNPNHLFLGTNRDNTADMDNKARRGDHHPVGSLNGRAVLTPETAREVRRLHAMGASYGRLAVSFGVGKSTISRVIHGESWPDEQET